MVGVAPGDQGEEEGDVYLDAPAESIFICEETRAAKRAITSGDSKSTEAGESVDVVCVTDTVGCPSVSSDVVSSCVSSGKSASVEMLLNRALSGEGRLDGVRKERELSVNCL